MSRKPTASQEGIEAASRTYLRCTKLLCEEFGAPHVDLGLGPRDTFEATVIRLRAKLQQQSGEASSSQEDLTPSDFSFNEVLRLMRQTAIKLAGPKKRRITREEFIREVNTVLQEEGGLEVAEVLRPNARTG